ncbi:MAG: glycosyl hydrolase-related protein [Oscillospiraceae bacterium]|jgi:alpha-mannosidase|nr:glycosyl hydrolase-related protein [Oscillospiraceae bacterium]
MIQHVWKFGEFVFSFQGALSHVLSPARAASRVRLQRAIDQLIRRAYKEVAPLDCVAYHSPEPLPFAQRTAGQCMRLRMGDVWAKRTFDCAWMHVTGQLPPGLSPENPDLVFLADISGEGLIVDREGRAIQGITSYTSFSDFRQGVAGKRVVLPQGLVGPDGKVDFWIDAAANDLFGNKFDRVTLRKLHIAVCRPAVRALYYDLSVLLSSLDAAATPGPDTQALHAAIRAAAQGSRTLEEPEAQRRRETVRPYLDRKNETPMFTYSAIGHAHLDLAWLWPIRETKRKAARTFASQLRNLERYPDARFGASQAQLYQWVKEGYPDLYRRIFPLQKAGQWEIQGATWVEMDSNLIGGESLVRQFYYGKRFFREEFGAEMEILWLPDSFGYSACIPQVMKAAGVPYFLTQKLSWNTVNTFPYHTFHWEGLDGSPVLAHMLPENTYSAPVRGDSLTRGEKNYKERAISRRAASLFGIGDGGGGPGFEHYERAARLADLRFLPKVTQEPAIAFFRQLAAENPGYPRHRGELYLEKHQGTYTTQARSKQYNRQCEFLLRNYEWLAATALDRSLGLPIPPEELELLWKEVLLYQFHDILPGSSINRVYRESQERYALIVHRLREGIADLLAALCGPGAAVNLNAFPFDGWLAADGRWRRAQIPAFSALAFKDAPAWQGESLVKSGPCTIENDCLRVRFHDGNIISLLDLIHHRELTAGPCNVFSLYSDFGNCWDIQPSHYQWSRRKARCVSFVTGTDGPKVFAKAEYRVGGDSIRQEISLLAGSPLLRFYTHIIHTGRCVMLRVALPLRVPTEEASFNIQFGHLRRATTQHNSIEKAQFEVSGQKFVDLSCQDFGISVLNDCKYGFRCKGQTVDIDLLRSPRGGPGRDVDFGEHRLTYAIYPHEGPLSADTYREAYFLNNPILHTSAFGSALPAETAPMPPLAETDNPAVIAETLKLPGDGSRDRILRLYNCTEMNQAAAVRLAGYRPAAVVSALEEHLSPSDGTVALHPFELITLRFTPEATE